MLSPESDDAVGSQPVASRPADWMFLQPSVLDEMHETVLITDLNGVITGCNRTVQSTYGYTPEELIGQSLEIIYPADDRGVMLHQILQTAVRTGSFRGEVRHVTRSGDYMFIHLAMAVLRDAEGRPAGLAGFSVDVTSQKLGSVMQRQTAGHGLDVDTVLRNMPEGLLLLDRDWTVTFVNDAGKVLLGMPHPLMLGANLWERLPAARGTRFEETFRRVVSSQSPAVLEEFYPAPINKWFRCYCYPHGEGLSVYFKDRTERQHFVAALAESDNRARLGVKVAKLALAEIDYQTGLNYLTAEAAKLFGIADQSTAVPRQRVHETFHPEERAELTKRIVECLDPAGTGWFEMDHRVVWPSGEVRWLRVRKQVYFTGEGAFRRPDHAVLAAFDVTLEHEFTEEVQRSEQQFRTLAESLPQFIWTTDPSGHKVYCNRRYCEYLGLSSLDSVDEFWATLIHPDDRDATMRRWDQSIATGEPYQAEYRLRRHDGAFRSVIVHAEPQRDGEGKIVRWIGSSTDMHEQRLADDLRIRTEKLFIAGRLAASVAHEINNPLSSVTNLLYLLSTDRSLNPVAAAYVATAQEQLDRVSEVATQALRFHRQSVAPLFTDFGQKMDSILQVHRHRILECGLEVEREFRPAEPLLCMAGDVRQALSNLVTNAIDASSPGGRLRIRVRPATNWRTGLSGIRVTIADTGSGIAADVRGKIFEPFFSTRGITHTGLGLWVAQDLLGRCGATISLSTSTNTAHHGTVLSIHIPYELREGRGGRASEG